jgi:hypothetical protein
MHSIDQFLKDLKCNFFYNWKYWIVIWIYEIYNANHFSKIQFNFYNFEKSSKYYFNIFDFWILGEILGVCSGINLTSDFAFIGQYGFRDTTARTLPRATLPRRHNRAATLPRATIPRATLPRVTFTARDTTAPYNVKT